MTHVAQSFKNSGNTIRRQSNFTVCSPVFDRNTTTTEAEKVLRDNTQLKKPATTKDITMDPIG